MQVKYHCEPVGIALIKVRINGIEYEYRHGTYYTQKLSEALDVGKIIIPHVEKIDLEPLDPVEIEFEETGEIKHMCVSHYQSTVSKYSEPVIFNYEIEIVSPTIKLQRVVLPNRLITQPLVGNKITIKEMFRRYIDTYWTGDFFPEHAFRRKFMMSSKLNQLLNDNRLCPEFQWNRPTLFEVFNDLLSVYNCVVTMDDQNTISYIRLDKKNDPIDDTFLNDIIIRRSANDYTTDIESELKNAVPNYVNAVSPWITPRSMSGAIVTDEDVNLILGKPIYGIQKVLVAFTSSSDTEYTFDITEYVVGKQLYDLAAASNATGVVDGNFKRNRLFYTQGADAIQGLDFNERAWLSFLTTPTALANIIINASDGALGYTTGSSSGTLIGNDIWRRCAFKVWFQTIEDSKFRTFKLDKPRNESVLITNQTTSFVDIKAFSDKQQLDVERFGNEMLDATGVYEQYSQLPKVSDFYDEYVLAEATYAFYQNHIEFIGMMSKNFTNKDLFTGINSRRRYTQIAQINDAALSHNYTRIELKYGFFADAQQQGDLTFEDLTFASWVAPNGREVNPEFESEELRSLVFKPYFQAIGGSIQDPGQFYFVDFSTQIVSNGVLVSFDMEDNFNIANKAPRNLAMTEISQQLVPYVDEKGEMHSFDLLFFEYEAFNRATSIGTAEPVPNPEDVFWRNTVRSISEYPDNVPAQFKNGDILPIMRLDENVRHKDNREITSETFHFAIYGVPGIFVKERYYELSGLVRTLNKSELEIWASNTETFDGSETVVNNGYFKVKDYPYQTPNQRYIVDGFSQGFDLSQITSWALVDKNQRILIAVNGNNRFIYLLPQFAELERHEEDANFFIDTLSFDAVGEKTLVYLSEGSSLSLFVTVEAAGYKQDLLSEHSSIQIDVQMQAQGFELFDFAEGASYAIGIPTMNAEGSRTGDILFENASYAIGNPTMTAAGFKPQLENAGSALTITVNLSAEGFKPADLSEHASLEITVNMTADGESDIPPPPPVTFTVRAKTDTSVSTSGTTVQWEMDDGASYQQSGISTLNSSTFVNLRTDVPENDTLINAASDSSFIFNGNTWNFDRWFINGVSQPVGQDISLFEITQNTDLIARYVLAGGGGSSGGDGGDNDTPVFEISP